MPSYDPAVEYLTDALAEYLGLIIERVPDLAAEASLALRVTGAPRQMRYDRLVHRALAEQVWTVGERQRMGVLIGTGRLPSGLRDVPVQVRLTETERDLLGQEAALEGVTLTELVRRRVLGL